MRRRRGTGSIEKAGNLFRFRCPDGTGHRYRSPAEYATEAEALKGLAIYRAALRSGELTPVQGITLEKYVAETWLPRVEKRQPRSYDTYKSNWTSQISKARFAKLPLTTIRRRDVRTWVDGMTVGHPEHPASVLKTILSAAVDDELVPTNVAVRLRITRKRREDTCPTADEERAILTCAAIPRHHRLILAFASDTALRVGEWRNLRLSDLHLDDPQPWIMVMRGSDDGDTTKSKKPRPVPLLPLALGALSEWLHTATERGVPNPHGLVFRRENGKRFRNSHTFGTLDGEDRWYAYRRAAGVTREVRLYDFRHRGATKQLMGEGGRQWSMREVQELLGHGSLQTTERHYIHTNNTMAMRAAREMPSGQNSTEAITKALETRAQAPASRLFPSSSPNPPNRPESVVQPENALLWPDVWPDQAPPGVTALAALVDGSQEDALVAVAPLLERHRERDPFERAFRRLLDPTHWRTGLAELIDLVGAETATMAAKSKGVAS